MLNSKVPLLGGASCCALCSGWEAGALCLLLMVAYFAGDWAMPRSLSSVLRKVFIVMNGVLVEGGAVEGGAWREGEILS